MARARRQYRAQPEDFNGSHAIDTGTAELVPDDSSQTRWTMVINGVPSSHVHLDDPAQLDFEYMQWMGHVIDALPGPGDPISVVHIGGAACAMALFTAATRPGSRQTVFEIDGALVTLARQAFGLRGVTGLRLRSGDGRDGIAATAPSSCDVVIRDAFVGRTVPPHLTTVEFHREISGVLRPGGIYMANIADFAKVREARIEAATARQAFKYVALIVEPGQLRGRRYGNVVLLASDHALPEDVIVRKLAGGAIRARYLEPARLAELCAGTAPLFDANLT
jgi:spermidine synthase